MPRRFCIRRRRLALAVLLLPVGGCGSLHPRSWSPWVSSSPATEQTEVIAATLMPPVHTVGFKKPKATRPIGLAELKNRAFAELAALPEFEDVDETTFVDVVDTLPEPVADPATSLNHASTADAVRSVPELPDTLPAPAETPTETEVLAAIAHGDAPQVIDLSSSLGMAGGNAWIVQLARQRTVEAHANLKTARALWLPNLQFGVGWNKHEGRIQATDGQVIETSRGSLFVGGGATYGAPVAGGSGGPFRLFADLALADAYFEPKIAGRTVSAQRAGISVAQNKALLNAGIAYIDLVDAAGQVADAEAAIAAANELLSLTQTFADAGAGALADVDRAATEKARLTQQSHNAARQLRVRSATLARRLRLDPRFTLQPADQVVVPLDLASNTDLDSLIGTALARRPEIIEQSHRIAGLCLAVKKAHVEPWLPSVTMATSGGTFGGGLGSQIDNRASRSDIDLQAVWELDSLGMGVSANRSRAGSQLSQKKIELADLRDEITAQVVQAQENVLNYQAQIASAEMALSMAESSYKRNLQRVRADEGLPIELLQAIQARAEGLRNRTMAVTQYNRAQLELLYATGELRP